MDQRILNEMQKALQQGPEGILCTVIAKNGSTPCRIGSKMWVRNDGSILGTIGGGTMEHQVIERALKMLRDGERNTTIHSRLADEVDSEEGGICGGTTSIFMEVVGRKREVVIFGGGHVGRAVAQAATFCKYGVTLWDDREDYAGEKASSSEKSICCPLEEAIEERIFFSRGTFVVVATRGHAMDGEVIRLLEKKTTSYIGMLASRSKSAQLWEELERKGVSKKYLETVRTPIGLDIGAGSPEEIAISIMAEIIAVDEGKSNDME